MTKAPDFTLENQEGKPVSLTSLKGQWVVLYFYPKDNTPGCTTEACDFTHLKTGFEKLNARIIGVSPDSVSSHQKFIDQHSLTIDLLSDTEKTCIQSYGAWREKKNYGKVYEGLIRSTFLIDPEGNVAASFKNVRAKGHAERILKKLEELQNE